MIKSKKRGQVNLSFGMIFSIILIIAFLIFAFYAIKTFLGIGNDAKIAKFIKDIQSDVNRVWQSGGESSESQEYALPKKISSVCFVDFSLSATGNNKAIYNELNRAANKDKNLIFYPAESLSTKAVNLEHINLNFIISDENPYCIDNNGKIELILFKNYGESLVKITE